MNKISKRKLFAMSKFNLTSSYSMYISMGVAVTINFIVAIIVGLASNHENGGGSIDFAMVGLAVALGAVMCVNGLKFALVNGVSRKTYFISVAISIFIAAIVYAVVTTLLMIITHNISFTNDIYYFMYCFAGFNWTGLFFFEFGAMLFSIALGYFAAIVFYRTRLRGKMVLMVAVLAAVAVLTLVSFFADIWGPIGTFFGHFFGISSANPFIGMAALIGLSALLLGGTFLILRRADIRG